MFATGETVGLAEWIIDDTCLDNVNNFTIWVRKFVEKTFGFGKIQHIRNSVNT